MAFTYYRLQGMLWLVLSLAVQSASAAPPVAPRPPLMQLAQASKNLEQPDRDYNDGKLDRAYAGYMRAAHQGDARAQFNVAMMLKNGEGREAQPQRAFKWLSQAATGGYAPAQFALGVALEYREFGSGEEADAFQWYLRAAHQDHPGAQLALATLYLTGRGTAEDASQAARWYTAAAESGDPTAQYILASLYEKGSGVQQDKLEALHWYGRAAAQGDIAAAEKVKVLSVEVQVATEPAKGLSTEADAKNDTPDTTPSKPETP